MCRRVESIIPRSLDGIMSQQRVASNKGAMTEVTGPGHFLVFGGLVSFEVMDPAKGFTGTEFTAESHCVCDGVVDHDGSFLVPDDRHALGSWEWLELLVLLVG